jgi:uncharacterized membrane protein YkoI
MKLHMAITAALATLAFACAAAPAAPVLADPVVSEARARAVALARVGGGTVQSAELEDEGGVRVWSFDIKPTKAGSTMEVLVDASSGKVLSAKRESAEEEAREAGQDEHKSK